MGKVKLNLSDADCKLLNELAQRYYPNDKYGPSKIVQEGIDLLEKEMEFRGVIK